MQWNEGTVIPRGYATRSQLTETGLTGYDLTAMVARGDLLRVRRDAYVDGPLWRSQWDEGKHALEACAVLNSIDPTRFALSHHSAAAALELPMWSWRSRRIHVMRRGVEQPTDTRGRLTVHGWRGWRGSSEVEIRPGLYAVDPAEAILGVAKIHGVETGLAAADAAAHQGLITPDTLRAAASEESRWTPNALRVPTLVDGRAESPGESILRLRCLDLGYDVEPQHPLVEGGRTFGYADIYLPQCGVILESDGKMKYESGDGHVLFAEKVREDRARRLGYGVGRVIWSDLRGHPRRIQEIIDVASRQASPDRCLAAPGPTLRAFG